MIENDGGDRADAQQGHFDRQYRHPVRVEQAKQRMLWAFGAGLHHPTIRFEHQNAVSASGDGKSEAQNTA